MIVSDEFVVMLLIDVNFEILGVVEFVDSVFEVLVIIFEVVLVDGLVEGDGVILVGVSDIIESIVVVLVVDVFELFVESFES